MDKNEFSKLVDQTGLTLTAEQNPFFRGLSVISGDGCAGHAAAAAGSRTFGYLHAGGALMDPFLTIAEAGRLIAAKQLSPVELTRTCLDRVKKLDPTLHSFLLVTEDRAMADAKAAEARMMAGSLKGRWTVFRSGTRISTTRLASGPRRIPGYWSITFPPKIRS